MGTPSACSVGLNWLSGGLASPANQFQPLANSWFSKVQIMAPTRIGVFQSILAHADFKISNSNNQPILAHADFKIPANNNKFNQQFTVHLFHPYNTHTTFVPSIHKNLYNIY